MATNPINRKNISVLPGDESGLAYIKQGMKVLEAVNDRFGYQLKYCFGDIGQGAKERFDAFIPEVTLHTSQSADAVYLGYVDELFEHASYFQQLKDGLKLKSVIRPFFKIPFFETLSPLKQELLEGMSLAILYPLDAEQAGEELMESGAFLARERKKKLTFVCDTAPSKDWSKEFKDIEVEWLRPSKAANLLIRKPSRFDIIVADRALGHLLAGSAAALQGSTGTSPAVLWGEEVSVFLNNPNQEVDPEQVEQLNPLGTILSTAWMLDYLGYKEGGKAIRTAVRHVLRKGIGTPDLNPRIACTCSQMGDLVASVITDGPEAIRKEKIQESVSTII
jgi:3-isopropylmalate dehydrogenase